jgi:LAO/AO transport system kinase
VQLIKAGLLEIADIVVVNKCDLPEGARLVSEIREELDLSRGQAPRGRSSGSADTSADQLPEVDVQRTDVVAVKAKWGGGIDDLLDRLLALDQQVRATARRAALRRRRAIHEVKRQALLAYEQAFTEGLEEDSGRQLLSEFEGGRLSLEAVVARLGSAAAERMTKDADGAHEGE